MGCFLQSLLGPGAVTFRVRSGKPEEKFQVQEIGLRELPIMVFKKLVE